MRDPGDERHPGRHDGGGAAEVAEGEPQGSQLRRWAEFAQAVLSGGRRVCGIPDYETYLSHLREHHPETPPMSFEEFFRRRLDARYGGRGSGPRCC